MAGTALRGRLTWQLAELVEAVAEIPRVKTIVFDVPGWPGHRAGQHVDVRLTAEDGYQAERSYSIAKAAAGDQGVRVLSAPDPLKDGQQRGVLVAGPGRIPRLPSPGGGAWVSVQSLSRAAVTA